LRYGAGYIVGVVAAGAAAVLVGIGAAVAAGSGVEVAAGIGIGVPACGVTITGVKLASFDLISPSRPNCTSLFGSS